MQKQVLQNLHNSLINSAKKNHLAETNLIEHIQKAEQAKLYLHRGHSSMFAYALDEIRLSETNAYNFIAAAQETKETPELKQALTEDNTSVSKFKKIPPVLDKWLKEVKNESKNKIIEKKSDSKPHESIKRTGKNLTCNTTDSWKHNLCCYEASLLSPSLMKWL